MNEPDLAALMNEVIKIPDGEDAGIIGDLFDRDFIIDLWEASVYALKAVVETEIAESLAPVLVRLYVSGYASGANSQTYDDPI